MKNTKPIIEYPEELTFDEFDDITWDTEKQYGLDDDRSFGEIVNDLSSYARKIKGQIYTQVDGDDDRLYARGLHFVNRTGIWWVVKKKGWSLGRNDDPTVTDKEKIETAGFY